MTSKISKINSMKKIVFLSALFLIGTKLSVAAHEAPVTEFADEAATKVPNFSPQFAEMNLQITVENFVLHETVVVELSGEISAVKAINSSSADQFILANNFDHPGDVRCCTRKVVEKIYLLNHAIRQC